MKTILKSNIVNALSFEVQVFEAFKGYIKSEEAEESEKGSLKNELKKFQKSQEGFTSLSLLKVVTIMIKGLKSYKEKYANKIFDVFKECVNINMNIYPKLLNDIISTCTKHRKISQCQEIIPILIKFKGFKYSSKIIKFAEEYLQAKDDGIFLVSVVIYFYTIKTIYLYVNFV